MPNDDPGMTQRRRSIVRVAIVMGMFAAVGIGFAIGWVVFHPTTPAKTGLGNRNGHGTGTQRYHSEPST